MMLENFNQFKLAERASRDTIDVKRIYIDMAGDLVAGVLLSQIVFWFLPSKEGKDKVGIVRDGQVWLVKSRDEWWEECRITPRQFDTAAKKLVEAKLIIKETKRFKGAPTTHIRINEAGFLEAYNKMLGEGSPISPNGEIEITDSGEPDQRAVTKNTKSKEKTSPKGEAPPPKSPKTEKPSTPPAVETFREMAHRFPAKSWYNDIAQAVGDDDASLQKWGQIVKDWVGKGFNPVNVKGMLDVFKKGWEGEQPANGHHTYALPDDYTDPEPPPPLKPGEDTWQGIRDDLQRQLPRETFNTWLKDCVFAGKDGHIYTLTSDNKYAVEWLRHRLMDVMNKTLRLHTENEAAEFRIVMPGLAVAEAAAADFNQANGIQAAPRKPGEVDRHLGGAAPQTAGLRRTG